jgi:hypothetical protein
MDVNALLLPLGVGKTSELNLEETEGEILHKKKKPSQGPSTPEMAFLRLRSNFYITEIT